MCLSTVYKNNMNDESVIMKKVASIALDGNNVILTDLMERKCTIEGTLKEAYLLPLSIG